MTGCLIAVEADRVRLRHGLLRGQRVHGPPGGVRIGVLGTQALLLGGDTVDLHVRVGPAARLDLFDVAGTVAYNGRGRPAAWRIHVTIGAGGRLTWAGQPFVIADGADVARSLDLELASDATLLLRETLVLGRTGERGGRVRTRTALTVAGRPLLREDQDLDPAWRDLPGLLGGSRVIDSLLTAGTTAPAEAGGAVRHMLPDGTAAVVRHLGTDVATSPLHRIWRQMVMAAITEPTASGPPVPESVSWPEASTA